MLNWAYLDFYRMLNVLTVENDLSLIFKKLREFLYNRIMNSFIKQF